MNQSMTDPSFLRFVLMALLVICGTILTAILRDPGYFAGALCTCFVMYVFALFADR